SSNLQTAFQGLTDGLSNLFRQHLELVRFEVKEEATEVGKNVAALGLFVFIALVGYGLLNLAAIFFAGWFGGLVAMAIAALALALINLGGAAYAIRKIMHRFEDNSVNLSRTEEEMQRNKQWIKQIRNNEADSPPPAPRLPAESS
ncbi:MAG: phage holin family protein, partial [Bradymonadaceae bacterium]